MQGAICQARIGTGDTVAVAQEAQAHVIRGRKGERGEGGGEGLGRGVVGAFGVLVSGHSRPKAKRSIGGKGKGGGCGNTNAPR
ncbi:MAG: hypothetical protein CMD92_03620 [Gammaproteobacteria bacterium]|nr:hypothetical protein [Gammaproteobacteria bacterium]